MGRTLFRRRPRGVEALPAADELVSAVARHLDALDEVLHGEVIGRNRRSGVLFIGGPSEFIGTVALPALRPLTDRGVRLRALLDVNEPVHAALLDGRLDMAVLTTPSDEPALTVVALHDEEYVLVASPARAAALGPIPSGSSGADQLADEPVIAFAESLPIVRDYWRQVFGSPWVGSPLTVANSLPVIAGLVEDGVGISVLPRHVCRDAIVRGTMSVLLHPTRPPTNMLHLAWRSGSEVNPTLAHACELLRLGSAT